VTDGPENYSRNLDTCPDQLRAAFLSAEKWLKKVRQLRNRGEYTEADVERANERSNSIGPHLQGKSEMPVRNQLVDLVNQLRLTEQQLLQGATRYEIAESLGVSPRQTSRLIEQLRELGVEITSDYEPGAKAPAVHKSTRSTRLFAR